MSQMLARVLEHATGLEPDAPPPPRGSALRRRFDDARQRCRDEAERWAAAIEANKAAIAAQRDAEAAAAAEIAAQRRRVKLLMHGGALRRCRPLPPRTLFGRLLAALTGLPQE